MAADVGAPVRWRSQLIAVLRVYPVQVFAAQRGVRFHRRLQVEVRFVRDAGWTAGATAGGAAVGSAAGQVQAAPAHAATLAPSEGMLEPLVMHMLANAELARAWRLGRSERGSGWGIASEQSVTRGGNPGQCRPPLVEDPGQPPGALPDRL